MTKTQKIEAEQKKQAKKAEYEQFREILKGIACDPYEGSDARIRAILAIFDFDDRRRELAGYPY